MKQNGKKGLSLPMEIIIGVVVLVVIALAVIMFTSGSITKTGTQTTATTSATQNQIQCNSQAISYCGTQPATAECDTTDCPACAYTVPCSEIRSADAGSSTTTSVCCTTDTTFVCTVDADCFPGTCTATCT